MKGEYRTIKAPSEGIYKDRGSRFLSFAFPVESEEEVRQHLNHIKKLHHQCNHHCYAFRISPDGSLYRSSDDREPSGSAGKPILNQLLSNDLTNTLIIVARYFGGSLLGVPGLINAYRTAAADAIINATIVSKTVTTSIHIQFPYQYQNEIMKMLQKFNYKIISESYGEQAEYVIEIPVLEEVALKNLFSNSSISTEINFSNAHH